MAYDHATGEEGGKRSGGEPKVWMRLYNQLSCKYEVRLTVLCSVKKI